jgi:hypothetical protein
VAAKPPERAIKGLNDGNHTLSNYNDGNGDDDDDDDDDDDGNSDDNDEFPVLQLQCASLLQQKQREHYQSGNNNNNNNNNNKKNSSCSSSSVYHDDTYDLSRRLLATCDVTGAAYIWDIGRRQIIDSISSSSSSPCTNNGRGSSLIGPGLTIRRLSDWNDTTCTDHRFFYQTRDVDGTIRLYDSTYLDKVVQTIFCHSQSFTSAAPCYGNSNLLVVPCSEHSNVMVRDWRVSSSHHPVAYFHGGTGRIVRTVVNDDSDDADDNHCIYDDDTYGTTKKYGMVTSLAMSTSSNQAKTYIACGMENGSVVYHDLAMIASTRNNRTIPQPCEISLSTSEPILALDMVPSKSTTNHNNNHNNNKDSSALSYVTVAGIAGNEEDLMALPAHDRGRIAILKTSISDDTTIQTRLRSRISTAHALSTNTTTMELSSSIQSKPGIGQCRFRPDGRLFAVGGWDKRVRIYDRNIKVTNATTPLAILRGHTETVNAIDWSFDAVHSGLMATGSSDGKVHIWRCFPSIGK